MALLKTDFELKQILKEKFELLYSEKEFMAFVYCLKQFLYERPINLHQLRRFFFNPAYYCRTFLLKTEEAGILMVTYNAITGRVMEIDYQPSFSPKIFAEDKPHEIL